MHQIPRCVFTPAFRLCKDMQHLTDSLLSRGNVAQMGLR